MKGLGASGINDCVICCGYRGYIIKEYFANYFLHISDVTLDMTTNQMEVHQRHTEPSRVTLSRCWGQMNHAGTGNQWIGLAS